MKQKQLIGITSPPYAGQLTDEGGNQEINQVKNRPHPYTKDKEDRVQIGNFTRNEWGKIDNEDFDITQYHKCGGELYWKGCYGSKTYYKQFVTPESYAHPAKISFLLTERIFKHLEHLGLLKEGMTVCDFMSGSGRIPLMASLRGYDSVGIELEPHFIKMCGDNKKFAENKVGRKLNFEIIQGDSRQLSKILNKGDVGITSPPFSDMSKPERKLDDVRLKNNRFRIADNYSRKEMVGKVEQSSTDLQNKHFVGVVSPPYQDSQIIQLKAGQGKDMKEHSETMQEMIRAKNYSQNPQNIGNLKDKPIVGITSPPYSHDSVVSPTNKSDLVKEKFNNIPYSDETIDFESRRDKDTGRFLPHSFKNIGRLKDNIKDKELVGITSPPYDNRLRNEGDEKRRNYPTNSDKFKATYPENENNVGNQIGQSYLSAMLQVYQEAYKSGMQVLVTITKNPTRAGKLRRLDLDTARLIEMAGFKIVDYHRAILFKTTEQKTLSGETKKMYKGRLSFFKRLSLAKGNQASMWEDIMIAVRT